MSLSKTQRILLGLSAVSGVATFYYFNTQKNQAQASWTTSYAPSPYAKWDENWDHRSPKHMRIAREILNEKEENQINEERESLKPKAYRHLILIRHGQYNLQGQTDEQRILTKLGRLQADYTGKRLKDLDFPYTDMVPVTNCDLLREGAPIPPEPPVGRYKPELYKFYQDGSRIEAAFRKYFHRAEPSQEKDSYTLLVCHANVIRYFVCRALQVPAEAWLRLSLNHASITWITITPNGRCVLRVFGDTGHMPPNVISST
ncbi:hypothetical protein NQ314_015748 [Rhamnusium bicolor]|uniref:Serine/threonine-protein phosphatase PGAM5, mitochondrial n=1 Tax=Rhamnusium bicolor TaxID=1586634 RepID=A0AAV8WXX9_9CUCU|nr:hypothetical protein NQ314_015748 [Rhamnusium bicolor]